MEIVKTGKQDTQNNIFIVNGLCSLFRLLYLLYVGKNIIQNDGRPNHEHNFGK